MRSVSPRPRRGGALLLILVALAVPPAYAGDGNSNDPEGRALPPVGIASTNADDPEARAKPPVGATSTNADDPEARAKPPGGLTSTSEEPPGLFESLLEWLLARATPPIG